MKSHKMIIIILVLLVILAAIGWIVARFSSGNPKVVSVKTYTASDGGFSFQYPEFEGWKSSAADKDGNIYFSAPFESVVAPSIKISRNYQSSPIALPDRLPTNPNGITYTNYDVKIGYLSFIGSSISTPQSKTEVVEISVPLPSPYDEQNSYSAKKMADMIIKTFKFSKIETDQELLSVTEMRDFSCQGIDGFTFRYPVFSGWDFNRVMEDTTVKTNGQECLIFLNDRHSQEVSAMFKADISVSKFPYGKNDFEIPVEAISHPNPNNIPTWYMKENNSNGDYSPDHFAYVVFYGKDYKYYVNLNISAESGFPVEQFLKTVIESFKILEK
ncbi:MAG: hypothetical protein ABI430_01095 [Candidatus Taylorbacteria bacterium]